jgi:serine/threonine-protein kinase RsbW
MRIVRLTVSGVASRLGFDVDEIENLRIAVDELASVVVDESVDGTLDISFVANGADLQIEGRAPMAPGAHLTVDELSAQILNAVCDKYEVRADGGGAWFLCVRRLPSI